MLPIYQRLFRIPSPNTLKSAWKSPSIALNLNHSRKFASLLYNPTKYASFSASGRTEPLDGLFQPRTLVLAFRKFSLTAAIPIDTNTAKRNNQNLDIPNSIQEDRPLAIWLFLCAGVVFCIVLVGGITRLTESGLSMIDWSLLHYKPPQSLQEWTAYFHKYQASPEYILLNQGMSLEDFQKIYYMEYAHRMLGRFLGLLYLGPLMYFLATRKRQFSRAQIMSLTGIGALILAQVSCLLDSIMNIYFICSRCRGLWVGIW